MTHFHSENAAENSAAVLGGSTVMNARPRRADRLVLHLLLSGMTFYAGGCGWGEQPEDGPVKSADPAAASKKKRNQVEREVDYHLKGVVQKVDLLRGSVTIAHEAIPGFMDAMTMPFFYSDRAVLESLAPATRLKARFTSCGSPTASSTITSCATWS